MILKGLLQTQLSVHSYSEGALQKEGKKEGGSLGDIYINLWLLTSARGAPSAGMWNSPFQSLTQARLQLQTPAAHAPSTEHSPKEISKL